MSDVIKDDELKKVNGAKDVNKRYTFFTNQIYRGKSDKSVTIKILYDYIDVPYDTQINVTYTDISIGKVSNENIPCWFIDDFYDFEQ